MSKRAFFFGLLATACLAAANASCSGDGGASDAVTDADADGSTPEDGSAPLSADAAEEPAADAAGFDAGKDAGKKDAGDAGFDAGKPPSPGDSCVTPDAIFTRACGACGTQQAICLGAEDGGPGTVTDYSPCAGELAGGCVPGTVVTEPCGNCGTHTKTCSKYCSWNVAKCSGEPVDSCAPTSRDYTFAGCPSTAVVRMRECGDACTWSSFSTSCEPLHFRIVADPTLGATVSGIFPMRAALADKKITGSCPSATLSTTTTHAQAYVEIVNPTNQTLTASAWNTAAPNGGVVLDTLMAWYATGMRPVSDADRKSCAKGVVDGCPSGLPCGDYRWAGLTGAQALSIPPLGSVYVWFGSYYALGAAGGSTADQGDVVLAIRTDALQ